MKKYLALLFLFGFFSLTSCSDDDQEEKRDPIIGTWEVVAITPPLIDVETCEEASTISFNENYTGTTTFYLPDECEPQTIEGTWDNFGSNTYRIEVPILGGQTGSVEFSGPDHFYFQSAIGVQISFQRQ